MNKKISKIPNANLFALDHHYERWMQLDRIIEETRQLFYCPICLNLSRTQIEDANKRLTCKNGKTSEVAVVCNDHASLLIGPRENIFVGHPKPILLFDIQDIHTDFAKKGNNARMDIFVRDDRESKRTQASMPSSSRTTSFCINRLA